MPNWPRGQIRRNKFWYQYRRLMDKARRRKQPPTKYIERHHALPVAFGGKKTETVSLTYSEHFRAHELLVKFCVGAAQRKMWSALSRMTQYKKGRIVTARQYAVARKATRLRKANFRHGHGRVGQHSIEYNCWLEIKRCCYTRTCKNYSYYGGRGIIVCDAWKNNFPNFLAYIQRVLGPRPTPAHSFSRKNNDKNYCPGNVKWATPEERATNYKLTPKGVASLRGNKHALGYKHDAKSRAKMRAADKTHLLGNKFSFGRKPSKKHRALIIATNKARAKKRAIEYDNSIRYYIHPDKCVSFGPCRLYKGNRMN